MLYAREAREGRLEEKGEDRKFIPIPSKIRNTLIGPFEMVRWVGERYCIIKINGKEIMHNVNRLVKHHVWDDVHIRTDIQERTPAPAEDTPLKVGELIVFPTAYNEQHKCVFGVGKVLQVVGPNDINFQW